MQISSNQNQRDVLSLIEERWCTQRKGKSKDTTVIPQLKSSNLLIGTFRSEYEYEFSVLSTRTLKNVDLET